MITLTGFGKDYGDFTAVDGVTFSLDRGKSLGVVGESGSGKTVLSRTIMGLLPSTAVLGGSVRFSGQEILDLDETLGVVVVVVHARHERVGRLPREAHLVDACADRLRNAAAHGFAQQTLVQPAFAFAIHRW